MKKILLIHTGGTFGMMPVEPDQKLVPGRFQDQIIHFVPEIGKIADIHVQIPFNLDSSNIGVAQWDTLARLIFNEMDNYDGFVIVHGTDTMTYTASALSFSLLNLRKPVVLTGSQRPLSRLRSDARSNLIDAVELASLEVPEVLIVFGQIILRGNRTKKQSITSYDAFDSPNYPHLGEIGLKISLNKKLLLKPGKQLKFNEGFNAQAAVINVLPSLNPENYNQLLESELKAFIILGFGTGNLPQYHIDWIPFIESAVDKGKSVFIGSHSFHGSTDLTIYDCGRQALNAGAFELGEMITEAAYVKLLKILKTTSDRDKIYQKFRQNWAGEI